MAAHYRTTLHDQNPNRCAFGDADAHSMTATAR